MRITKFDEQRLCPNPLSSAIKQVLIPVTVCSGLLVAGGAHALSFDLSDEVTLDWDTTVRYSAGWRIQDQDADLLSDVNSDDGNRNFDKGLMQNRLDVVSEFDLNYRGMGAFVRGRAFYDDVYSGTNDHTSPATSNNASVAYNKFTDDTQRAMGRDAELLDAFVYGFFDVAGRDVSVRLGRQVVSWGESLFIQGGISAAQAPLDATKSNIPGVELKEIFLPVGQLYGQANLTENVSVEGYYQYEWEKTRLDGAGGYFSTSDAIDEGGETLILGPGVVANRVADTSASDSGQWGVAFRYLSAALNYTEFGLYYANYHDKTPQFNLLSPSAYNLSYIEDIHLVGASFGTVLGDTNVSGEVSYRENAPVAVRTSSGLGSEAQRAEVLQTQISAIHGFGASAFADDLTLTTEIGMNRVLDVADSDLVSDRFAWGYSATLTPNYFAVLPGVDLQVPVSFNQGVNGKSSVPGTFSEGKSTLGVSAKFTYLSKYQAQVGYTNFLGDPSDNKITDRDIISMSFKTTF